MLAAAAAALVGALVVFQGARWWMSDGSSQTNSTLQVSVPAPVVDDTALLGLLTAPPEESPAAPASTGNRKAATPRPRARSAASAETSPAAVAAREVDEVDGRTAPPVPVPASAPAPAPAIEVVAEALPPSAPQMAAPTGRILSQTDVDEPPKVTVRVEPRLPTNLPDGSLNDVVVLRILVSETGHPFNISVLRGSRVGQRLDDAVVEAVKQWTFVPATKKGEAVNSWFNIGVPLDPVG